MVLAGSLKIAIAYLVLYLKRIRRMIGDKYASIHVARTLSGSIESGTSEEDEEGEEVSS